MSGTAEMSTAQFAQLVAEIEVAELERGAAIAPVFLWLWEHRVQVRGLLTAGTSWVALAGALGRIGLGDGRGAAPSVEHCRAAWGRVVAFEPLVAGRSLTRTGPLPVYETAQPELTASMPPASAPEAPIPAAPNATRTTPPMLGGILGERRRAGLADPAPLDLAAKDRRPRREAIGETR